MTLDEAADALGIAPAYMQRLVEQGVVPAHWSEAEIDLDEADVVAFRDERERRHAGLAEIAGAEEALGITY